MNFIIENKLNHTGMPPRIAFTLSKIDFLLTKSLSFLSCIQEVKVEPVLSNKF